MIRVIGSAIIIYEAYTGAASGDITWPGIITPLGGKGK